MRRCGTFGTLQVGLRDGSVGSGVDSVLLSRGSWALSREGKEIEGRPLWLGLGE